MTCSRSPVGLPVAGIIPFSATDWPDMLTVTAFTQGCPWRCVYCHNPSLQSITPGEHTFDEVMDLLDRRRGLVDGLVISGGEPTVHKALGEAIATVHGMGFPVGVHTCGYAPARLEALLDNADTRPEWIGLDVKALARDLPGVVGCSPKAADRAWRSLDIVARAHKNYGMAVQCRTTMWPGSIVERHLDELTSLVNDRGFELVIQHARGVDADGIYVAA